MLRRLWGKENAITRGICMEFPQERTEPPYNPAMLRKYAAEGLWELHVYCCTIQKGQETQTA